MTVTYTIDGGLVGVSFLSAAEGGSGGLDGGFGGGGLPSFGRTFLAKLTSSIILDEGAGDPTWSRSTKAWGFNELGYLKEFASGCAVFGGVRLVRNTVRTTSEDFSNAAWSKTVCTTPSANVLLCANSTTPQYINQSATGTSVITGQKYRYYVRVKSVVGGASYIQLTANSVGFSSAQHCNFSLIDGSYSETGCTATASLVSGTTDTYDFTILCTATATADGESFNIAFADSISSNRLPAFTGDGVQSFELLRAQSVDVTNYNASYIPEYVSVGVEASPYFGAGIDGAKYFETNWQGSTISPTALEGFRRESSATNNLLHCADLSNAAWSTKTNITATKTAVGLNNLADTATILTATAANAIILQPITLASAARCASAYVKRRTGTGTISFTQDGGSTWTDITSLINSSTWSRVQITATLANPSVGFKITTSGDAIDVDCVQNEAGGIHTSPILTTTAAVTRNSDSLTYQTTSNIAFAQGTLYAETKVPSGTGVSRFIQIGVSYTGIHNSNATTAWRMYDGTTVLTKQSLSDASVNFVKRAISWGDTIQLLTGDGAIPASSAFDSSFGDGSTISIGVFAVGIKTLAVYNYKYSEADLQAITS